MAEPRRIARVKDTLDLDAVTADTQQFALLSDRIKELTVTRDAIKSRLSTIVERYGEVDDRGHLIFALPGVVGGYKSLVRQRRSKRTEDVEAAEQILRSKGLYERCTAQVPVLDEDEIMAAHYEGLLTQDDIDAMFPEAISYAFAPAKED